MGEFELRDRLCGHLRCTYKGGGPDDRSERQARAIDDVLVEGPAVAHIEFRGAFGGVQGDALPGL